MYIEKKYLSHHGRLINLRTLLKYVRNGLCEYPPNFHTELALEQGLEVGTTGRLRGIGGACSNKARKEAVAERLRADIRSHNTQPQPRLLHGDQLTAQLANVYKPPVHSESDSDSDSENESPPHRPPPHRPPLHRPVIAPLGQMAMRNNCYRHLA
jgi:hypothetical protein